VGSYDRIHRVIHNPSSGRGKRGFLTTFFDKLAYGLNKLWIIRRGNILYNKTHASNKVILELTLNGGIDCASSDAVSCA
jgi:hypothetical protein